MQIVGLGSALLPWHVLGGLGWGGVGSTGTHPCRCAEHALTVADAAPYAGQSPFPAVPGHDV